MRRALPAHLPRQEVVHETAVTLGRKNWLFAGSDDGGERAAAASADVAATLAQRFYDAGNISDLELTLNRAAATQAHLAAVHANIAAQAAKYDLQSRLGLRGSPTWSIASELPAPSLVAETPDSLIALAQEHRGHLRAAHQEVTQLDDALRVAKRWRWLGVAEVGVQREREPDGRVLTGPTLALALPLFNQGQAGIARGEAELEISQARLQSLEALVENSIRLDVDRVAAARGVAEAYRQTLVPEHALIVKREQERQNFMLIGQFELLLAKQQEYDTYQKYLEAVRDYWLARVELVRAVGADLKASADAGASPVGVEEILTAPASESEHMEHHHGETPPQDTEHHHHEGTPMPNMPDMPKTRLPDNHASHDHPEALPPGGQR